VADRLDELTHDEPGRQELEVPEALLELRREPLDQQIVGVLGSALNSNAGLQEARSPAEWPAGLSGREVEVLRLVSRGMTRRQIAQRLTISENTVRHHLSHVYDKTGTTNRVSATLFAMEQGLLQT
jgi:DNA-binding NarL/FixJ family response regulator